MENRKISDSQIKSSSQLDENHSAKYSRLHLMANRENGGSWSALKNGVNQWLQVDLGSYIRVTGIVTQGRNGHDEWVTKFRLQYGEDEDVFHFFEDPGDFAARVCIVKRFSQISLHLCYQRLSRLFQHSIVNFEGIQGKDTIFSANFVSFLTSIWE